MDKALLNRVGEAIHETLRHTPLAIIRKPWNDLPPITRVDYRAVAHSALVAAGPRAVWVVTDESDRSIAERHLTSVVGVFESREAALAVLPLRYGGAEDIDWQEHNASHYSGMYGEYPWVMERLYIEVPA